MFGEFRRLVVKSIDVLVGLRRIGLLLERTVYLGHCVGYDASILEGGNRVVCRAGKGISNMWVAQIRPKPTKRLSVAFQSPRKNILSDQYRCLSPSQDIRN